MIPRELARRIAEVLISAGFHEHCEYEMHSEKFEATVLTALILPLLPEGQGPRCPRCGSDKIERSAKNNNIVRCDPCAWNFLVGNLDDFTQFFSASSGGEHLISSTYGDLPESVRNMIQPHEWDNMNFSQQRDWAIAKLAASSGGGEGWVPLSAESERRFNLRWLELIESRTAKLVDDLSAVYIAHSIAMLDDRGALEEIQGILREFTREKMTARPLPPAPAKEGK